MAGLFDLLFRPEAMQSGGLFGAFAPPDQSSPLDNARWPHGPIGAPSGMNAMAQAPMGAPVGGMDVMAMEGPQGFPQPGYGLNAFASAPTAQPQANPLEAIGRGLQTHFNNGMRGLEASDTAGGALLNFMLGRDPNADTRTALQKMGVSPELAPMVARNPAVMSALLQRQMGLTGGTDDIKEFEYAQKQGFRGTLQDWMQRKRAGAGEYGLNAIWGTGPDGKPAIVQLGKGGEAVLSKMPEGFQPNKDIQKIDLGTHWAILDPTSRSVVATLPKNIAEAKAQEKIGESQGEARAAIPAAEISSGETVKKIDQLIAHPGLKDIVGRLNSITPNLLVSDSGRDARARYEQLRGTAFLEAFQTLKGGGAITEVEGTKAENAIARMDRAVTETDFRSALKDFRDAVDTGMRKLRAKAGTAAPQAPSFPAPPAGFKVLN